MDESTTSFRRCTACGGEFPANREYFYTHNQRGRPRMLRQCIKCFKEHSEAARQKSLERRRREAGDAPKIDCPPGAQLIPLRGRKNDASGNSITVIVGWALVDEADYLLLSEHKWSSSAGGYATCRLPGQKKKTLMHRFIILPQLNDGRVVDHINMNKLDNRRENLRASSSQENSWNAKKRPHNRQKYKGVGLEKSNKNGADPVYYARIGLNGRSIRLGVFKSQEDAARAYDEAAIKYFGEYARLNFPVR